MTYKVVLIGRLTQDPEVKTGNNGENFCRMRVAVNSRDRDGDKTDFWDVVAFKKTGENCSRFLAKKSQVYIEGRPEFDTYQARDGQMRVGLSVVAREVTFLSGGSRSQGQSQPQANFQRQPQEQQYQPPQANFQRQPQEQQYQPPQAGGNNGDGQGQTDDPIPF